MRAGDQFNGRVQSLLIDPFHVYVAGPGPRNWEPGARGAIRFVMTLVIRAGKSLRNVSDWPLTAINPAGIAIIIRLAAVKPADLNGDRITREAVSSETHLDSSQKFSEVSNQNRRSTIAGSQTCARRDTKHD